MRSDSDAMTAFSEKMTGDTPYYTVLQQDNRAHVVRDHISGTTGYVLYEAGKYPAPKGANWLLVSISDPGLVMIRPDGEGHLRAGVCTPDLGKEEDGMYLEGKQISITLRGHWIVSAENAKVKALTENGVTTISMLCKSAMPVVFDLFKK
jgi:chondroitin-sulfate-ABC endolyase/exolyase